MGGLLVRILWFGWSCLIRTLGLGLLILLEEYNYGMNNKKPLYVYVISVIVTWIIILSIMWSTGNVVRFQILVILCLGFMLGMFAMYIATRVYKVK